MISLLVRIFINKSGEIASPHEKSKLGTLCCIVGIVLNVVLFLTKYIVGLISGSISIITDAFNNITDAGTSMVMLIGMKISSYGRGDKHPQGHGRFEWIISSMMAFLVMGIGWNLLCDSFGRLSEAKPIVMNAGMVTLMLISVAVKGYMYIYNKKYGAVVDSEVMKAVSADSISDAVATLAVLLSILLSIVFKTNLDKYCGMLVSVFIIYNGFTALCDTANRIVGTAPDSGELEEIRASILSNGFFDKVYELTIEDYGRGNKRAQIVAGYKENVSCMRLQEEIEKVKLSIKKTANMDVILMAEKIEADANIAKLKADMLKSIKRIEDFCYIDNFRVLGGEDTKHIYLDIAISKDHEYKEAEITQAVTKTLTTYKESYVVSPSYKIFHGVRKKPWVRTNFALNYDTYIDTKLLPKKLKADATVHHTILKKKLYSVVGKEVLDIACRSTDAAYFLSPNNHYIGEDMNPSLLKVAEEKLKKAGFQNYELIEGNACNLPFEEKTFDVVLCNLSMQMIYPIKCFLLEANRVLKNNGIFIGSVPVTDYGKKKLHYMREITTCAKLKNYFHNCGFTIELDDKENGLICYFKATKLTDE